MFTLRQALSTYKSNAHGNHSEDRRASRHVAISQTSTMLYVNRISINLGQIKTECLLRHRDVKPELATSTDDAVSGRCRLFFLAEGPKKT